MTAQGPLGNAFGPLYFTLLLHDLPYGSWKDIPKFYGDGKQLPDEHIVAFYIACGVLGSEHGDVFVRLFIEIWNTPRSGCWLVIPSCTTYYYKFGNS